jgi:hypothetical protein
VHRERPLHADAERLLPDGEGLTHARALALDDDALEDLDARALALDHAEVDTSRVAGLELREIGTQLPLLDELDGVRHERTARRAGAEW